LAAARYSCVFYQNYFQREFLFEAKHSLPEIIAGNVQANRIQRVLYDFHPDGRLDSRDLACISNIGPETVKTLTPHWLPGRLVKSFQNPDLMVRLRLLLASLGLSGWIIRSWVSAWATIRLHGPILSESVRGYCQPRIPAAGCWLIGFPGLILKQDCGCVGSYRCQRRGALPLVSGIPVRLEPVHRGLCNLIDITVLYHPNHLLIVALFLWTSTHWTGETEPSLSE
jgi:hypothetical protein